MARLLRGELATSDESGLHLFEGNPLFVAPRSRDKHIFDVFPKIPMCFQVDLNGHFAASLIGYVLNPGHNLHCASSALTGAWESALAGPLPFWALLGLRRSVARLGYVSRVITMWGFDERPVSTRRKILTGWHFTLRQFPVPSISPTALTCQCAVSVVITMAQI